MLSGRYRTSDMALDALDLVEAIGWKKFHLIGASMGEFTLIMK
jgi:pimeloyl-ACP methyl ester carboxylesterase